MNRFLNGYECMSEFSRNARWWVPAATTALAAGVALGASGCASSCNGKEVAWKGNLKSYGADSPISLSEAAVLLNYRATDYTADWTATKNAVQALINAENPPAGMTYKISVGAAMTQDPGLATQTASALPAIASQELGYPVGGSPDGPITNDSVEIFVEPVAPPPTCESTTPSPTGTAIGAMSLQRLVAASPN